MPQERIDREEYVEQAYFFRALAERIREGDATQDVLAALRDEVLATTKLPLAIDFLIVELRHTGGMATAMRRLEHYFTPFQCHLVAEAEDERGRFDFGLALEILERDARYRAEGAMAQGVFLFQFEALCRHRLGYDRGLKATSRDPIFDDVWRKWIGELARQISAVDLADLIYVRSEHYRTQQERRGGADLDSLPPPLFGEREGKIALANRRKDPLWLFAALERHLGYPAVPRRRVLDETRQLLPLLQLRVDRLDARLKLVEEEVRGGIDLERFYGRSGGPNPVDDA